MHVIATLLALLGTLSYWLAVRRNVAPSVTATWRARALTPGSAAATIALVLAACLPLLLVLPLVLRSPAPLSGDARSHALIAQGIATRGIARGWIDVYQGGFPLGPHYPSVGFLLAAALIRLGAETSLAVQTLGVLATLATPVVVALCVARAGGGVLPAACAGMVVAIVAPPDGFVGGVDAWLYIGVLSQVLAMPLVVLLAYAVATDARRFAVITSALLTVTHPQVTATTLLALGVTVALTGARARWASLALAAAASFVAGAAVFGPGLATLEVPYGWPPAQAWRITGFPPERLSWWLGDAELLDKGRAPVLTALWGASIVVVAARARAPLPRAVLVANAATLAFSVSGTALARAGRLGAALLSFLQPIRVMGLVPLVVAAAVAVALHEVFTVLAACDRRALRVAQILVAALVVSSGALCLPRRIPWRSQLAEATRGGACGTSTPRGFDAALVGEWLARLDRGRLAYDDTGPLADCADRAGLELASAVPVGVTPAAGGHVGVHWQAFHAIRPGTPGGAGRAESLGVRYWLQAAGEPLDPTHWSRRAGAGDVTLWERIGGTDVVGVGCLRARWSGADVALRESVTAAIRGDGLDDPTSLVELVTAGAPLTRSSIDEPCVVEGATVAERPREPGAHEAVIDAPGPLHVVIRVAPFPTWRVTVDGRPVAARRVLPGFLAVPVDAGRHTVVATTSPSAGHVGILLLALGAVVFLAWRAGRSRHDAPHSTSRST